MIYRLIYLSVLSVICNHSVANKHIERCRCLAHLDVANGLSDENRLQTLDLTERLPPTASCDNREEFLCKAFCKEFFKEETNDFDLDKPPKSNTTVITESLGQYLCDTIHKDLQAVQLGMDSELTCVDQANNKTLTSTLKIFCDKKLTCVKGKYVKQYYSSQ